MDRRERNHKWYSRFDEDRMQLVVYEDDEAEFIVPAKYEVCETCEGKGSHVNPAIDAHGITADEWNGPDWDDESREMYMKGGYDQPCNECHGRRVVPVPDRDRLDVTTQKKVDEAIESFYQDQACYEAERRMGA